MEKPGQGVPPAVCNVTDAVKVRIAVQHKRAAVLTPGRVPANCLAKPSHTTRSPTRPLPAKALRALFVFMDGDNVRIPALVGW